MRSLAFNLSSVFIAALALSGCLVSEDPVLDASNGKARPIAPGDYNICPLSDDSTDSDCARLNVTHDATGLYVLEGSDGDPVEFRFRKIARDGFAAQAHEDDDSFMYYYARGDSDAFHLTLMMCKALPDRTRARLVERGSLTLVDGEIDSCVVNDWRGLKKAAKAYHRGVDDDEPLASVMTPASADTSQQ